MKSPKNLCHAISHSSNNSSFCNHGCDQTLEKRQGCLKSTLFRHRFRLINGLVVCSMCWGLAAPLQMFFLPCKHILIFCDLCYRLQSIHLDLFSFFLFFFLWLCLFAKILTETGRKCEKIKILFIKSYVSQLEKDLLHPIFLFLHVLSDKCRRSFSNCET